VQRFSGGKRKGKKGAAAAEGEDDGVDAGQASGEPVKIVLSFKRYVFDPQKKMVQTL
jgi:hypothetical protein